MIEKAGFSRLCKECKGGTIPREEMKKQFLMVLSKILSKRVGKRLHSLQILAKVTSSKALSGQRNAWVSNETREVRGTRVTR